MKKAWIWIIVVIVILAVAGYFGRHKIKSMLGMNPPAAAPAHVMTAKPTEAMKPVAMASSSSTLTMTKTNSSGKSYLTDAKGMTLYTYSADKPGVSNCNGGCLSAWPAFAVKGTPPTTLPTNISVITRSDGSKQYAWDKMPLYYFAQDTKPGDANGTSITGWHVVTP